MQIRDFELSLLTQKSIISETVKCFGKIKYSIFKTWNILHAENFERTQVFDYLLIHVYHLVLPPLALITVVIL
jgi:hypothetical protein